MGGSIGLALAGTIFGSSLVSELPSQLRTAGVPQPIIDGFAARDPGAIAGETTGVGVDLGAEILAALPEQVRATVEPFVGAIVEGIHGAFSIAIAHTMWLGVAAALAAAVILIVALPEIPLRTWREAPPAAE